MKKLLKGKVSQKKIPIELSVKTIKVRIKWVYKKISLEEKDKMYEIFEVKIMEENSSYAQIFVLQSQFDFSAKFHKHCSFRSEDIHNLYQSCMESLFTSRSRNVLNFKWWSTFQQKSSIMSQKSVNSVDSSKKFFFPIWFLSSIYFAPSSFHFCFS